LKKLYLCGSFRFQREMDDLERKLQEEDIVYIVAKSKDSHGILGCLGRIDDSDVVYIVNPDGYVGKSVSVDIGYAYAKNKQIYARCPVDDPPVENLISGIMTPDALIDFLKADLPDKKR
jgi:hypothetical protein